VISDSKSSNSHQFTPTAGRRLPEIYFLEKISLGHPQHTQFSAPGRDPDPGPVIAQFNPPSIACRQMQMQIYKISLNSIPIPSIGIGLSSPIHYPV
jgi:hypothetical protein